MEPCLQIYRKTSHYKLQRQLEERKRDQTLVGYKTLNNNDIHALHFLLSFSLVLQFQSTHHAQMLVTARSRTMFTIFVVFHFSELAAQFFQNRAAANFIILSANWV